MKLSTSSLIASCALAAYGGLHADAHLAPRRDASKRLRASPRSGMLVKQDSNPSENYRLSPQSNSEAQTVDVQKSGSFKIPLRWTDIVFVTTIALGTPPQPFHAAIDLSWRTSMALSSECETGPDDWACEFPYHWMYNSSLSSTFVPNKTKNDIFYGGADYPGHLSQDTLHLIDLKVEEQVFHEAKTVSPTGSDFVWDYIDGILGLAPPLPNVAGASDIGTPVLSNLISQGKLDANIMSLNVPTAHMWEQDRDGEILFGATDPSLYQGELTMLPLTFESDPGLEGKWTIDTNHVQVGDINESLDGFTAIIDLKSPTIALPGYLLLDIVEEVGAQPLDGYEDEIWHIPCIDRDNAPDFTINLSGHNFTMNAWEYARPTLVYDQIVCPLAFSAVEVVLGPKLPKKPTIVIGVGFLNRYYSVFDMDNWEVGFAKMVDST